MARIIQGQSRNIPTVGVSDPLGQGLVANVARPGGNLTGIANPEYAVTAKLLEILKEIAPSVVRAALVLNPENLLGLQPALLRGSCAGPRDPTQAFARARTGGD